MITNLGSSVLLNKINSPCQHLGKCTETSMENINTDVRT